MGRKSLPESERRVTRSIKLRPAEIAWLESRGGVSEGIRELLEAGMGVSATVVEAPQPFPGVPAPAVGMRVSPYSGKPLCPDCQRKGANIHCRACGANARGAK